METTLEALKKRLEINQDDLDTELADQSAVYLYIAEKHINAEMAREVAKMGYDKRIAELDESIRLEAVESEKKITEKSIEKMIDKHTDAISKRIALIRAKGECEVLKAMREAFYMRKDMLIQLAIKQRSEVDSLVGKIMAKEKSMAA